MTHSIMTNNILQFVIVSPLNLTAFPKKEVQLPRKAKIDLGEGALH